MRKPKKHLDSCWCDDDNRIYLLEKLLEYRRKHNIFEVGDKVVHPKFGDTRLYEVREVKGSLVLVYFDRLSYSFNSDLRHATDEEIKQGRRL